MINDWLRRNVWFLVLVGLAFAMVGNFAGWLVGQSRAPAIPALLPLVIGLLGGFSYALFEKRVTLGSLLTKLEEAVTAKQLPQEALSSLRAEVEKEGDSSLRLPAFWAACIIVFILSAYIGHQNGIRERVPDYPDLGTLLNDRQIPPDQRALLYQLEVACRSAGLTPSKYSEVMRTVIVPLLDEPLKTGPEYTPTKESRLRTIVDGFRQNRIDDILRPIGTNVGNIPPK